MCCCPADSKRSLQRERQCVCGPGMRVGVLRRACWYSERPEWPGPVRLVGVVESSRLQRPDKVLGLLRRRGVEKSPLSIVANSPLEARRGESSSRFIVSQIMNCGAVRSCSGAAVPEGSPKAIKTSAAALLTSSRPSSHPGQQGSEGLQSRILIQTTGVEILYLLEKHYLQKWHVSHVFQPGRIHQLVP